MAAGILFKRREEEKNGSRPYRAGLVSCSLSWLIQLNEIPQRRHLNCLQREHTQTQVRCPLAPLPSSLASSSWLYASLRVSAQLIYIYVQLKCLRQCLHNLTNCKAQARRVHKRVLKGVRGCEGGQLMQLQCLAAIIEINFQAEQTSNNLEVIA